MNTKEGNQPERAAGERPRVLFLYNYGQENEVRTYRRGEVPAHRLFGLSHLHLFGYRPLKCPEPPLFRRPYKPLAWRVYQALYALARQRRIACVVATHEASALPVLVLKRIGLLRTPVIVTNIALLQPRNCSGKPKKIWRWCLPAADAIVSYASAQIPWLREEFGIEESKLSFLPLNVDTEFFSPSQAPREEDGGAGEAFCLSVGTNDGKDFATLLEALPPDARLEIHTDEPNALLIAEMAEQNPNVAVHFKGTPIEDLRERYKRARFLVLPLHEARFSSGQTVLLENMALGRPIIISRTSGVRDYIEPGVTAVAVEPGDVPALRDALEQAWRDPKSSEPMARRASVAAHQFSCEEFARKLSELIGQVTRAR